MLHREILDWSRGMNHQGQEMGSQCGGVMGGRQ